MAVPVGDPPDGRRLSTFLPLGEPVPAPLHGLANVPFFAELNRRSFNKSLHWNALLPGSLALACARTALLTTRSA
ncbi:hypothetical protein AB0C61_25355 [Streptomyces sp. NPDC048680]|uniref:hypothetical protein n=1 Tax=Streptomyces sp. NPDC048680 TaxID=3155492 RepID=UPI003422EC01